MTGCIKVSVTVGEKLIEVLFEPEKLQTKVLPVQAELVKLTATEYTLLALFVKNEGKVLTHQYLLREVWGPGYIQHSQYLRVFIAQLRKKIETDPNNPTIIITESGVGYRLSGE